MMKHLTFTAIDDIPNDFRFEQQETPLTHKTKIVVLKKLGHPVIFIDTSTGVKNV